MVARPKSWPRASGPVSKAPTRQDPVMAQSVTSESDRSGRIGAVEENGAPLAAVEADDEDPARATAALT